jgi:molybdopterin molybdotransferase
MPDSLRDQAPLPPTLPPKPGAIDPRAAWEQISGVCHPLAPEPVAVGDAAGRWLARDAVAAIALPMETNSAMDGFAVRADAVPCDAAVIVGESRAGVPFAGVATPGSVIRIATGAAVPDGFDAVVPIELAHVDDAQGTVQLPSARRGAHIRHAGEDVRSGDLLVPRGTRLAPNHLVALAASGIATVQCHRRPVVTVVVTGDEVVPPGTTPQPGQVIDVHGTALPALIQAAGCTVGGVLHVTDGRSDLADALHGLDPCDVVVVTGGLSVGRHDHTRRAFAECGVQLIVERLLMRPGQPTAVGTTTGPSQLWFGLPGNPVSAFVVATLLLEPALRRLAGDPAAQMVARTARLRDGVTPDPRRWLALRAELCAESSVATSDAGEVVVLDGQASHMMGDLARADRLALLPPGSEPLPPGAHVSVVSLPGCLA